MEGYAGQSNPKKNFILNYLCLIKFGILMNGLLLIYQEKQNVAYSLRNSIISSVFRREKGIATFEEMTKDI